MRGFLIRLLINAIGIAAIAELLPGITISNDNVLTLLFIAFIFGIVNAILKPILVFMTCPAVIVTLGLFLLVINGLMLLVTDELLGGTFDVDGFGTAILGGLIMGLIGMVLESVLKDLLDEDDDDDGNIVVFRGR